MIGPVRDPPKPGKNEKNHRSPSTRNPHPNPRTKQPAPSKGSKGSKPEGREKRPHVTPRRESTRSDVEVRVIDTPIKALPPERVPERWHRDVRTDTTDA